MKYQEKRARACNRNLMISLSRSAAPMFALTRLRSLASRAVLRVRYSIAQYSTEEQVREQCAGGQGSAHIGR